ncbi:c-type cytochrome [Melaminivora alkalimesophila]|uniref:Cytochrome c556 n=1 Tax=Melaminivora alkalimesophila TaxID=1165852 RepID=A0A317RBX0_9BURK|nr:cytochrome c [Melaminivora alkalimesophila]PWW45527.1 cytochrome c556 [Melaminivora alkalimesophila]TFI09710.1 cytochrome c [Thiopseudomonas sp. 4R-3cl]
MHIKTLALAAAAAGTLLLTQPAAAQFAKAEDAIKYRQSTLFVIGQHFGRIGAMVNGKAPYDAKAAEADAEVIASLASLPWTAFGPGTDKGNTKAKPEVWSDTAKFTEHAQKFQAEAPKLLAAAKTGNLDALKAAFGPTANSCKACHDSFRSR